MQFDFFNVSSNEPFDRLALYEDSDLIINGDFLIFAKLIINLRSLALFLPGIIFRNLLERA